MDYKYLLVLEKKTIYIFRITLFQCTQVNKQH